MKNEHFSPDFKLENDRVLLRPMILSDYELLLPYAEQEPELWRYSLVSAGSPTLLRSYMELALNDYANQLAVPFVVVDKRGNKVAGSTRFYSINDSQKNITIGCTWYGKAYQGTGLNKKCKALLLDYAFEQMGMERVELRADNENERSKAAMRSLGAIEEGVLRNDCYRPEGGRRASVVFSILREEWDKK